MRQRTGLNEQLMLVYMFPEKVHFSELILPNSCSVSLLQLEAYTFCESCISLHTVLMASLGSVY
jgi:hypothetical protein